MERPKLAADSLVARGLDAYRAVLKRSDLNTNLKVAWFALLELSYYRFRSPLNLNPADLAASLGLSQAQALRYIRALADARLIHVYKTPDGKSRLRGANYWPCCLLDPFVDVDEQIRYVEADPQTLFDFTGDDDRAAGEPAAAIGTAEAGNALSVVPFKPGHDAPGHDARSEAAATTSSPKGPAPSTADGPNRLQLGGAAVHPPAPRAELATTPREVRLKPSRDNISRSALNLTPNRLTTSNKVQGANRATSGGVVARSAAGEPARAIGDELAERYAKLLDVDPTARLRKIDQVAAWLVAKIADPVCRIDPKYAAKIAAAVVDGDLAIERVEKIFHDRARQAATPSGVKSPFGYFHRAVRNAFVDARLDWSTGRKLPD